MGNDWQDMGAEDYRAGHPRAYGAIRTAGVRWGRRRALADYRSGWDRADLHDAGERVERLRALVDAPVIGRVVTALQGADYAARRDYALGLLAQLGAEPDRADLRAMYAGAVASVRDASGVDTGSELWTRTRELFHGDDADIRACDALRTYSPPGT